MSTTDPRVALSRRTPRRILAAVMAAFVVVATLVLAPTVPAAAAGETTEDGNCRYYINDHNFGYWCSNWKNPRHETIKEFLDVDKDWFRDLRDPRMPECWIEDQAKVVPNKQLAEGENLYLETCILRYEGINLAQTQVRELRFTYSHTSYTEEEFRNAERLPEEYEPLIELVEDSNRFPATTVSYKPEDGARVGQNTIFYFDAAGMQRNPGGVMYLEPLETPNGALMTAFLTRLEVYPDGEGPGKPKDTCSGSSINPRQDVINRWENSPFAEFSPLCTHVYERSSRNQIAGVYSAVSYATWDVMISDDGGNSWHRFGESIRQGITRVAVREVQTIVVP